MAETLVLHNNGANPPVLHCLSKPCKHLSPDIAQLLSAGELVAYGNWSYCPQRGTPPNPLTVLHALSGDGGPDIRLLPNPEDSGATHAFNMWHQADSAHGRCIVVRFPQHDRELVFVPAMTKTGTSGTPSPVYWGFTVTANLLPLAARAIHTAKLMVVFDIDETLLMAHTLDSLQTRLQRVNAEREARAVELAASEAAVPVNVRKVAELQKVAEALEAEQGLLQKDFELLSFFRQDPACRGLVDGRVVEPSWECSVMSTGVEVTRPVVRLEAGGRQLILTRIHPELRSTSLLIRPRPGWDELRAYLSGVEALESTGVKRERWEVYLCTTAEREYAWEAWRLLDPQASIFPQQQLEWRMLCVQHPQKKDLLNVLRKQAVDAASKAGFLPSCPSDPQFVTDKARAARPAVGSPVPLCVVVDDRLDVWEEDSRKAVLQVMPFHPHKEASALQLGPDCCPPQLHQQAADSELELLRVAATLRDVRSLTYQTLDKEVKPEVQRLTTTGVMDQLQDSAASILATLLLPLKSVPQLLAESVHKPPAALASSENDERASDLRLLAGDGTMMSGANGNNSSNGGSARQQQEQQQGKGAAAAGAAASGKPPSDPRKRRLAAVTAAAAAGSGAVGAGGAGGNLQEQELGKKRKKEKARLFDGINLASIMTSIGAEDEDTAGQGLETQQQQQQQQQQQESDGDRVLSGVAGAQGAPGAASGLQQGPHRLSYCCSSDRELNLESDEEEQQQQGAGMNMAVQRPEHKVQQHGGLTAAAATAGGSNAGGSEPYWQQQYTQQQPQEQQQQQEDEHAGDFAVEPDGYMQKDFQQQQLQQQQQQPFRTSGLMRQPPGLVMSCGPLPGGHLGLPAAAAADDDDDDGGGGGGGGGYTGATVGPTPMANMPMQTGLQNSGMLGGNLMGAAGGGVMQGTLMPMMQGGMQAGMPHASMGFNSGPGMLGFNMQGGMGMMGSAVLPGPPAGMAGYAGGNMHPGMVQQQQQQYLLQQQQQQMLLQQQQQQQLMLQQQQQLMLQQQQQQQQQGVMLGGGGDMALELPGQQYIGGQQQQQCGNHQHIKKATHRAGKKGYKRPKLKGRNWHLLQQQLSNLQHNQQQQQQQTPLQQQRQQLLQLQQHEQEQQQWQQQQAGHQGGQQGAHPQHQQGGHVNDGQQQQQQRGQAINQRQRAKRQRKRERQMQMQMQQQ